MATSGLLRFTLGVVFVVVLVASMAGLAEANYKNAPMNGIMFGKRAPTGNEYYEARGRTYTAFCEIATEACQAWFPAQESK